MLKLATPPEDLVVTLAEARAHLRVGFDDDNDYIQGLILAAIGLIDGADGWLGRALSPQTWKYEVESFPCGRGKLRIPLPPLISIVSIEYTATDGNTASLTNFREFGAGSKQPAYILPGLNENWPSTQCSPDAVRIEFSAGYEYVPAGIKHAILLMVGHWYENREAVTHLSVTELPLAVGAILNPYRNWLG